MSGPVWVIESQNIYQPEYIAELSTSTAMEGIDLLLTGSIQELYFGDANFNVGAYHFFGILGAAASDGKKAARISVKCKLTAVKENRPIFEKRIEITRTGRDLDRTTDMDAIMAEVAMRAASYFLETN